ncbi:glutamine ABC transporter permease GlnP [Antarctobacter heliothermus]|uniref:Glutamine ABC transporter permease GlnP n=1 Tax=Antarctobacter heliothermus TaxID=74033 RepID=A0A222E2L5_9RHOB|nr:amino acid ABC transporter permease [Antarctobacter heliothermus]ASP20454.1 glutamine ABC transporter permease GlnP [Antarctobacter heliothermus]
MNAILQYFFDWDIIVKSFPFLLKGLVTTLIIAALTIVFGLALGLLLACLRAFHIRLVNLAIIIFADVLRSIPALVLLIVVYFALPEIGIRLSGFVAVVLVLSLVMAAFAEEIIWSGIIAVDQGQWEAGRSTGLTFTQTLGSIVLLQAVQMVIPPLTNKMINITKNTALASVISVSEMLNQASSQQALYANPTPLTLVAILYVALFFPLVLLSRRIEARYSVVR